MTDNGSRRWRHHPPTSGKGLSSRHFRLNFTLAFERAAVPSVSLRSVTTHARPHSWEANRSVNPMTYLAAATHFRLRFKMPQIFNFLIATRVVWKCSASTHSGRLRPLSAPEAAVFAGPVLLSLQPEADCLYSVLCQWRLFSDGYGLT